MEADGPCLPKVSNMDDMIIIEVIIGNNIKWGIRGLSDVPVSSYVKHHMRPYMVTRRGRVWNGVFPRPTQKLVMFSPICYSSVSHLVLPPSIS